MKLINSLSSYMEKVLGIKLRIEEDYVTRGLPYFLREKYDIYKAKVIESELIFIIDKSDEKFSPVKIRKHVEITKEKTELEVVYVKGALSSFQRDRLIKYKVNFVIPGNQMYLPYLKLDLREHFKQLHLKREKISPASQAILILCILNEYSQIDTTAIQEVLSYSAMTISRAFRELSKQRFSELVKEEKINHLKFYFKGKELFNEAKSVMSSPVLKECWLKKEIEEHKLHFTGMSALSRLTLIVSPGNREYAIDKKAWSKISQDEKVKGLIEPEQTESNIKLQVWNYMPEISKYDQIVDKYSLYLSLRNIDDERVEQALEELLGK